MIISIIGGGATGCTILFALLQEIKKASTPAEITINVFEPHELGRGVAYANDAQFNTQFKLNTSVSTTIITPIDKLHLLKWLDKNKTHWQKLYPEIKNYNLHSFLPRSLIGLYIQMSIKNEIAALKNSMIKVNHINEFAIDVKYNDRKKITILTKNHHYPSNFCILATGYLEGIPKTFSHLSKSINYFSSPYKFIEKIHGIPKNKRILIIGTGLSGIDAAIALKDHKNVVMASRQGRLPAVRKTLYAYPPKYLTDEHIKNFFKKNKKCSLSLIKKEIEKELALAFNKKISLEQLTVDSNTVTQLKKDIFLAKKNVNLWEDTIMTITNYINTAWLYLSLTDKKKILTQEMRLISRYISAFPYQNAKIIYRLLKKETLSIRKGIKCIKLEKNYFIAQFQEDDNHYNDKFDYVINATPITNDIRLTSHELYKNLITKNLIKLNCFGGVKVNHYFQVKGKNQFYAAGPTITGSHLVTNFLFSSAQQGHIIAKTIFQQIQEAA